MFGDKSRGNSPTIIIQHSLSLVVSWGLEQSTRS
jgi:hypothetical protein